MCCVPAADIPYDHLAVIEAAAWISVVAIIVR
jgi:hypothetical protein